MYGCGKIHILPLLLLNGNTMFDLTNEDEMNPYTVRKAKPPSEVKPIPKKVEKKDETPKSDANNEYDYSDKENEDDTQW